MDGRVGGFRQIDTHWTQGCWGLEIQGISRTSFIYAAVLIAALWTDNVEQVLELPTKPVEMDVGFIMKK